MLTRIITTACLILPTASVLDMLSAAQGVTAPPEAGQAAPYTYRVTKSEVVLDIIAVDAKGQPIVNLLPHDLEVFDEADGTTKTAKAISNLRLVDPSSSSAPLDLPRPDFFGLVNGSCATLYSVHYQLSYNPGADGGIPGIHTVELRTKRRGVKLSYRHGYFVTPPEANNAKPVIVMAQSSQEPVNTTAQIGREGTLIAKSSNSF